MGFLANSTEIENAKFRIEFSSVGRDKLSWRCESEGYMQADLKNLKDVMIASIRKRGALMSRDIELECNEDGTNGVIIVGGSRVVGKFIIQKGLWSCTPRQENK